MPAGEAVDRRRQASGLPPRNPEPFVDDEFDGGGVEGADRYEVGLGVERFRPLAEQRSHERRLRTGEEQADGLEMMLQLRPEKPGGPRHPGDPRELVEHHDGRLRLACPHQCVQEQVKRGSSVGTLGPAARKTHLEHSEVEFERGGDRCQPRLEGPDGRRQRLVEENRQIGRRRHLVEIDPDDRDAASDQLSRHPGQHTGLAIAPGPDQRGHPTLRHPFQQIEHQVVAAAYLLRRQWSLIGKG